MKIYCKVTDIGLIPMYGSDLQEKKKLKRGECVLCEIRKPRNYEFHKKFFALVRLTFDNLPEELQRSLHVCSEEDMLTCMKLDLGYADVVEVAGRHVIRTRSISFASMDNTEFQKFYDRCVDLVLGVYLAGTDREDLQEEIMRYK